jgi:hypothetical protein
MERIEDNMIKRKIDKYITSLSLSSIDNNCAITKQVLLDLSKLRDYSDSVNNTKNNCKWIIK